MAEEMQQAIMWCLTFTQGLTPTGQGAGRSADNALQQTLGELRDAVGAAVYVSSYTDGEVSISRFSDGRDAPAVYEWVDFKSAAHASAVGKSLLAQLTYEQPMEHLSRHRAEPLTPRTITNHRELFEDIDGRGPRAAQFDRQEYSHCEVCVAIPLNLGSQADALALSLPASQQHRLREAAQILTDQSTTVLLTLLLAGNPPVEPTTTPQHAIAVVPPSTVPLPRPTPISLVRVPCPGSASRSAYRGTPCRRPPQRRNPPHPTWTGATSPQPLKTRRPAPAHRRRLRGRDLTRACGAPRRQVKTDRRGPGRTGPGRSA
ncbi:IclR family transcriptional regulator C-terminal domain-containing protein [Streptomyces sp. NPDC020858]|uniref:IclR family transcriptional regulator domain-containing protein n=1 Tax=Streptomyces sp. NPDC020858 TaxID=3365097 RepID=UPI003798EC10